MSLSEDMLRYRVFDFFNFELGFLKEVQSFMAPYCHAGSTAGFVKRKTMSSSEL
jgi:hypothetical protein